MRASLWRGPRHVNEIIELNILSAWVGHPGYQTTYHSETQQGTGHWEGVVFQQQFASALQVRTAAEPNMQYHLATKQHLRHQREWHKYSIGREVCT